MIKKTIIALMVGIGLGVTGCAQKELPEKESQAATTLHVGIEQDVFDLPYTITEVRKDLDGDGKDEMMQVVLTEGKDLGDNRYEGKCALRMIDDRGQVLQELSMDDYKILMFPKNFEIVFKDYNQDGILDFNIGYENVKDKHAYYYKFYTLMDNGQLSEMKFMNYYWIKSCYTGNSYAFPVVDDQLVSYYKIDDMYYYESYKWEKEGYYGEGKQLVSHLDYKDLDKSVIRQHLDTMEQELQLGMTRKQLIDATSESMTWLLEHQEQVDVYAFNHGLTEKDRAYRSQLLTLDSEMDDLNERFISEGIYDFKSLTREELQTKIKGIVKDEIEEYPYMSYEDYPWHVDEEDYRLAVGHCGLSKFMLLYDHQGQFVSGHTWSDNVGLPPQAVYRKKQNAFSVTPIHYGRGTGISLFGGRWFELYKGNLIPMMDYLTNGHEVPPPHISYAHVYRILNEVYSEETGDYQVTYYAGINISEEELKIGTKVTVYYKWLEDRQQFDMKKNIHDVLYEDIFYEGIEDDILSDSYKHIKSMVNSGDEFTNQNMIPLLAACGQSNKRDSILKTLRMWCLEQEDQEYYIKLIQIIDNTLKRS
ncbi:hypothetical protein HZI73_09215 [Vallitalea pronyensis]|uniref:Uncharacterized protein n=1 Tax=Vallitalea pronyensis TaxID=1348613 RepID=A0A8J8MIV0_9FIRM|nr:hypothetical protein [Vallitalea pronyensis]QUI22470.1 hypothetical protein HZI73_09215 [Vallitalea pronyensis]